MFLCLAEHTELMALQAAVVNGLSVNGLALPLVNICQSCASFFKMLKKEGQSSPFFAAEPCGDFICVFILLKSTVVHQTDHTSCLG